MFHTILVIFSIMPLISGQNPAKYPDVFKQPLDMPKKLVNMRLGFDIYKTSFNFKTMDLDILAQVVMVWADERVAFNASAYGGKTSFVFENGLEARGDFHLVLSQKWLPPVKKFLEQAAYKGERRTLDERVTFFNDGQITFEMMAFITLPCAQDNSHYPFDQYSCWMLLSNFDDSNKITISPPRVRNNVSMLMTQFQAYGHKLELRERRKAASVKTGSNMGPFSEINMKLQLVDLYFIITRNNIRDIVSVCLPVLCITITDFIVSIFSASPILQLSFLPLYTFYFEDLDFTNAVSSKPPIARLFYGRLYSSLLCQCLRLLFFTLSYHHKNHFILRTFYSLKGRIMLVTSSTSLFYLLMSLDHYTPPETVAIADDQSWW